MIPWVAKERIHDYFHNLSLADTPYEAVEEADGVALCTEWKEFQGLDWAKIKKRMKGNIIFDGRNTLSVEQLALLGFRYFGIGRN